MSNMKIKLTPLQMLGAVVLVLVTIFGFIHLYIRVRDGLIHTNLTQHVPWGIWVGIYIYFIGLSAGSFLLSTMVYVFGVKKMEPIGPLALIQALLCLCLGGLSIMTDLGHWERMWLVITNGSRTSVLAWEAYFYTLYAVIIMAELYIVLRPGLAKWAREKRFGWQIYKLVAMGDQHPDPKWTKKAHQWLVMLGIIGIPCAFGVHGGTGSIFAVIKARDYWYGGLFPIIFLVSAMVSGGGLLTFLTAAFVKLPKAQKLDLVLLLARLTLGILAFDLVLLSAELLTVYYGRIPHHTDVWNYILFGPFFYVFWFLQVGTGIILPVLIVSMPGTGRKIGWLGFAGFLVVLGMIGTRMNIVIPALIYPMFHEWGDPLTEKFGPAWPHHLRWSLGYNPSFHEYMVAVAIFSIAIWLFILAFQLLPLRGELEEIAPSGGHS